MTFYGKIKYILFFSCICEKKAVTLQRNVAKKGMSLRQKNEGTIKK